MPTNAPLLPAALPTDDLSDEAVDAFIATWQQAQASERSNAQSFLIALCGLLGVPAPEAAQGNRAVDAYIFERAVDFQDGPATSTGFIDLYKRGCFVLETKQGVDEDRKKRRTTKKSGHGTRGSNAWERTMKAAKEQAARYARNLDVPARSPGEGPGITARSHGEGAGVPSRGPGEGAGIREPLPPFVIACDAGYCFDLYANFGHPQRYAAFPDQRTYRILLTDLRDPATRATLRLAFTDPEALDPSRRQAEVTRELAATLAQLAADLEADGHSPDAVFGFLTRCLFTMFAEDTDLLPPESFTGLLREYRAHLDVLPDALESLWATMDAGGFSPALKARVRRFNGKLFAPDIGGQQSLPLTEAHLDLLLQAATADWRNVEPAIFGTLLERALDPRERHKLGAHYTPRAYVERLVMPTVIDPLREEWDSVQVAVARVEEEREAALTGSERGDEAVRRKARREILDLLNGFLGRLTSLRVLDPACGSGNFLYVTLEHLKRLEAEVRALLERYGGATLEMQSAAVTPEQLLGIELNPRAAAIADLVLWIGFLQWHLRTYGGPQALAEPILHAYGNIECRDAVLAYADKTPRLDADGTPVTIWDGRTTKPSAATGEPVPDPDARIPVYDYTDPRPAAWPAADFIVGNPPFLGGWLIRQELGGGYAEALWEAYPHMPQKTDFVMYWWDRAAEAAREGEATRFGLITTNSVGQVFQSRVIQRHTAAKENPLTIVFAVSDHPWVDSSTAADVRIAMTVAQTTEEGRSRVSIGRLDGDTLLLEEVDVINPDLSTGVDVSGVSALKANKGLSSPGVQLYGAGFILEEEEAKRLRATVSQEIADRVLRAYMNGRDLMGTSRDATVIDFFGMEVEEARHAFPSAYQVVLDRVKPERDQNKRKSIRETWWRFGWERPIWREASDGLPRFIVTPETSKHRVFVFLNSAVLPDNMLTGIATDDAFHLGVLSSVIHVTWSLGSGGRLGVGNDPRYTKTKTFEPFPFPAPTDTQRDVIRDLAEQLDAHRKRVLAAHADLTLTGLYNVLDALREAEAAGGTLSDTDRDVYERGQVGLLRDLHDRLDAAVAEAYGWGDLAQTGFPAQEVLRRVVALNAARQAEEAAGLVRWLRPSFQAPDAVVQTDLGMTEVTDVTDAGPPEPEPWPATLPERARAVRRVLTEAARPQTAEQVARAFRRAPRKDVTALLDTMVEFAQARVTEGGAYAA